MQFSCIIYFTKFLIKIKWKIIVIFCRAKCIYKLGHNHHQLSLSSVIILMSIFSQCNLFCCLSEMAENESRIKNYSLLFLQYIPVKVILSTFLIMTMGNITKNSYDTKYDAFVTLHFPALTDSKWKWHWLPGPAVT